MNLKGKKVLITGGAGFIGSHTGDALIKKGAKVVVVDNLDTGLKENINKKAKFYKLNIADKKLEQVFKREKPEIIYHFAANAIVPRSVKNPLIELDAISGTLNILVNAQKYGVKKIIFSSSSFIYGNSNKLPLKEGSRLQLISPYAISKATIEQYLDFFRRVYHLPYVALRYATVYGPRQRMSAMADYVRTLKRGDQAEIWGDGTKTRDYVYIDDIVKANLLALKVSDSYKSPIFNVGSAKETTLNELYYEIAKILGKKANPIYLPDRPGELIRYCVDYSKIKKELGWKPTIGLKRGLSKKAVAEGWMKK